MALQAEQISLARTVAGRLATTLYGNSWFLGMDVAPTQDGRDIVLLLYVKREPPLHQKRTIPSVYENFHVIIIDESKPHE
jgi:hypothetical protein